MMYGGLAQRIGLMIAYCSVISLVALSMIEMYETMVSIIGEIRKTNQMLLSGALAVASVPSAGMLFWSCKGIVVEVHPLAKKVCRFFGAEAGSTRNRSLDYH